MEEEPQQEHKKSAVEQKIKSFLKKHLFGVISLSTLGSLVLIAFGVIIMAVLIAGTSCDSSSDDSVDSSALAGGGGSWATKDTDAYKQAEMVFKQLTEKEGFSGAGAAGAIAVGARESGWNSKATNSGGGVAGWFQWSGFSNSVNGSRITAEGSIKAGDASTLTPENEIKLLHRELNSGYKKAKTTVGNATDPEQAAKDWSVNYEGVALSDGQSKVAQTIADADTAYILFGGANIYAQAALLGGVDSVVGADIQDSGSSDSCGSGSSGNSGDILDTAKSLIGYFTYLQSHGVSLIGSVENPDKSGQTDCSGFVWLVLKKAGYKVPDNMGWYTKTMAQDAQGAHQWLQEVDSSEAKAGDIIIANQGSGAGNNGHTAVLAEDYHGTSTKIVQEGGSGGDGGVNEGQIGSSFGDLLSGEVTYARAQK